MEIISPIRLRVSLGVLLLLAINGCFASSLNKPTDEQVGMQLAWLQGSARLAQERQAHPLRFRSECPLESLKTLEPSRRIEGEAGYSELWDVDNEQLVCAGSAVLRHVIRRRGLFLPSYTSTSELLYVLQGRGVHGVVIPGCRDTYQSAESDSEEFEGESRRRRVEESDRHQKVREIKEGDVIGLPAGLTHWIYNDAQSDLVLLSVLYTASEGNQLDESIRKFFLAGNPQHGGGSFGGRRHQQGSQEGESFGNIFRGFDEDLLSQTYNVEGELARRLRGEDDQRGHIIQVQQHLQIARPPQQDQEDERWESENGIEETICSFSLKENIDNPVRADFYNPRAGRITTLTSFSLPILAHLQLSAEKGVIYSDAVVGPRFYPNSHALVYVIRGSARIQIVGESGNIVFDGEVQERQLFTLPQGFVVVNKAGSEGFEWIAIRTNDVAVVNPLAGRLSVFRTLPEDVIVNAYGVSKQDARNLKYNREELAIFSPTTTAQGSTTRAD